MVIYIKRAVIILVVMTLVVTYLTITLYKKGLKPAFSGVYDKTVIIDAGHGEPDGGAVSSSGIRESEINLQISEKVSAKLEKKCYNVVMTRVGISGIHSSGNTIKEKKLSDMHNREKILNGMDADLFLSIHLNFFSDENVSGAQVFYSPNKKESEILGEAIRQELIKISPNNDRILKKADKSIYLLEKAKIPACLIECGFLSNKEDAKKLMDNEYQEKIADAIVLGIDNYFNGG